MHASEGGVFFLYVGKGALARRARLAQAACPVSTVTLDTGALIALERRRPRMWKVLHRARALGVRELTALLEYGRCTGVRKLP